MTCLEKIRVSLNTVRPEPVEGLTTDGLGESVCMVVPATTSMNDSENFSRPALPVALKSRAPQHHRVDFTGNELAVGGPPQKLSLVYHNFAP